MRGIRRILTWVFRSILIVILLVALMWTEVRISRAYYRRTALQGPSAFIVENSPVIALIHARLIDGSGSSASDDQTVVIQSGQIADFGPTASVAVPNSARILDLNGKTILPGLVMLHEHLYTNLPALSRKPLLIQQSAPFPLMYLAAGVTTLRTAGSIDPEADLTLKHAIDSGDRPGPNMFLTAPYLEGKPALYPQMRELADAADARQSVDKWASRGMTSFKAYMHITPDELRAAIEQAHTRGFKITGHLCSVGFTEAADMGIDNLEHGIMIDEEFYPNKQPGVCPDILQALGYFSQSLDIASPKVQEMIRHLVDHHVALTSTLAVDEDFSGAGQPLADMEDREYRALGWQSWAVFRLTRTYLQKHPFANLLTKEMQFEHDFAAAGGLLLAGSDPTGDGGTPAGYGDQRELELLVRAGFTPIEAIHVGTSNGAQFLGQSARIGTIEKGKQADLVVIAGDPSRNISDIRNVNLVFRNGIGYSSAKLFAAVRGLVGVP